MKESQARVKKRSEERDDLETIKAAAWAVFQHNNGGGSNGNRHPGYVLIRQATRFKIEAQMQKELERRAMAEEALPSWDAGSTLFDKYELDSVFKHLDLAYQSIDTQHQADNSKYYDETAAEPAPITKNRYTNAHHDSPRLDRRNWLETVNESQRFRGSYLESVDESLPLANAGYDHDVNVYRHEEPLKPKLDMDMEKSDEVGKEVVPQGKVFQAMQLMPSRWNVLNGRRCSFDTSPDEVQKTSKQSRKSKLLGIFRSKPGKDGKPSRQARIVPDDSSSKPKKTHRRSRDLAVKSVVADPHDSDSSDSGNGDGEEHHHPRKGQAPRLKKPSVPRFSRAVRLSSDMSNPNAEEGLRNHLRHGTLTYGHRHAPAAAAPGSPTTRSKTSYSLNVTSPVQTPRRSMLDGSREGFDPDNSQEFHHEYHHHHHHHHHHIDDDDDYELTVPDIVRRVSRKSFEEMAHRFSIEESTAGMKAPRNSLESPFFITPSSPGSKLFL